MNWFIAAETSEGHAYLATPYGEIWHVWMQAGTPLIERLTEAQVLGLHINLTKHQRSFARDNLD